MDRRTIFALAAIAAVFLAWHVPLAYRTPAGLDEDLFGVTGTTIHRTGVPRIPYIPTRDPRTIYYGADITLYILPPLSFYIQSAVQVVLGDGLGPARMASILEALAAAWLVFDLARIWLDRGRGAVWAVLVFLYSRAVFFPATIARPDMAATLFGLLAVRLLARQPDPPGPGRAALAGLAGGLSLLSHPMGVVPNAQAGLRLLLGRRDFRRRLLAALVFSLVALAVFALWLPLIALHRDLFWIQFPKNVTGRASHGLLRTLLNPFPVFAFQGELLLNRTMPYQAVLYLAGLVWVLGQARHPGPRRELAYHLVASFLLLMLANGRHPVQGYYAYPAAFASIAVGGFAGLVADHLGRTLRRPVVVNTVITLGLIAALFPGSGIRIPVSHLRHWNETSYDSRALAKQMMADLPRDAKLAVDGAFVLDFFLAGRDVMNANYMRVLPVPFDYLVVEHAGPARAVRLPGRRPRRARAERRRSEVARARPQLRQPGRPVRRGGHDLSPQARGRGPPARLAAQGRPS